MSDRFEGTRAQFETQARAYAESKYAYGALIDDFDDFIDGAIHAGETPEYFVEWLAEKYDLNPISNGWN